MAEPQTYLHLYGKSENRPGRKMGHVTGLGASVDEALRKARAAASRTHLERAVSDPLVGIAMGSASDLPTLQPAVEMLQRFGVSHEVRVLSAHRTPEAMAAYAREAVAAV